MNPPFTIAAFLRVFATCNAAIRPFQIAANGLGLLAFVPLLLPSKGLMRLASVALAILWAFTAIGYHLMYFATINPVTPVFAAAFVVQAILFLTSAIQPADVRLRLGSGFRTAAGLITIVYTVVICPILGIWAGHGLIAGPMFGVARCPTTMFTIGLLLLARGRRVIWFSVIPFLWSLIGWAARPSAVPEDIAKDFT